jgi:hypothetical protein
VGKLLKGIELITYIIFLQNILTIWAKKIQEAIGFSSSKKIEPNFQKRKKFYSAH